MRPLSFVAAAAVLALAAPAFAQAVATPQQAPAAQAPEAVFGGNTMPADPGISSAYPSSPTPPIISIAPVGVEDILFNDRALALQVPYADLNAPIACQTLSTAQRAGWIWDIGLSARRGVGHRGRLLQGL